MGFLDNLIGVFSPEKALRREIANRRRKRLREWSEKGKTGRSLDAITEGRTRYDFLNTQSNADSAIVDSLPSLRNKVRELEYKSGDVSGPLNRLADNIIGSGIRFQSRIKSDDKRNDLQITEAEANKINKLSEKYFKIWAKRDADVKLKQSFYGLERSILKALFRDGELLVIGRYSKNKRRLIPYCQEIYEIDRLCTPQEEIRNPKIRHGIEYDDEGCAIKYYVLKQHPGESLTYQGYKSSDFEELDRFNKNGTQQVLHIFEVERPEQTRGYSKFLSALKIIQDKDRYKEAEILAALEDACLMGIVESEDPETLQGNFTVDNLTNEDGEAGTQRIHEYSPNAIHYLGKGEKFETHRPQRPNTNFGEFLKHLDREAANGINIVYEIFSQNWAGMNYSNARTVLLQFYLMCRYYQRFIIESYCIPTHENVFHDLIANELLIISKFPLRKDDYLESVWIPPGWSWVDPVKEAQGKKIELEINSDTLTDILQGKGKDFEEVVDTKIREAVYIKEQEEKFNVKIKADVFTKKESMNNDDNLKGDDKDE